MSRRTSELKSRLAEAEAIIRALIAREIDAVIDATSATPVLLSHAQLALRESEERYRQIVETSLEGIFLVDAEGTFTFANRRLAELFGRTVDEIVGHALLEFVPPKNRARAAARLAHANAGASEESEVTWLREDGTELWVLLRTAPVKDGDGRHVGNLGMMTDKSSSRLAEESLRKSEAQYRQIVENTSDGIIQVDESERLCFVNRRLAEMLGYEPSEMIGMYLPDLMGPESEARMVEHLRLRKAGSKQTVDNTYRHRDGTDVPVSISGTGLFDDAGNFTGTLGIVRDVTERNKLQSQLMVSDRMASIGTLAAGVAHEINNPLAAVVANLDFIAESMRADEAHGPSPAARDAGWLSNEIRVPISDAQEAAHRMRFVVRDLKVFSHASGDAPVGPVDVEALMDASLRMADNEIRHRARVIRQFGGVPYVQARAERLGQVFLNLLVNAAQALPDGHAEHNEIRVATRLDGSRVIIEVSDSGPGIPPTIIVRVFDAFFTTKPAGSGTGLGLSISHRIVTDLGGELTVKSELGKGTTFRVALPVAATLDPATETPTGAAEPAKLRGRILLVDDEAFLLRITMRVLGKDHEVVSTLSATEALSLISAGERFDLILCDLMMPQMTGMDLHRELSRLVPEQARRMIFLTGGAFTPAAQAFLAEAAVEYIEKPFDSTNLRAIVQRHLRAQG
jgi:PAS domain S-box-containing protein